MGSSYWPSVKPLFHSSQKPTRKHVASAFKYCDWMKVLAASLQIGLCDEWKRAFVTLEANWTDQQYLWYIAITSYKLFSLYRPVRSIPSCHYMHFIWWYLNYNPTIFGKWIDSSVLNYCQRFCRYSITKYGHASDVQKWNCMETLFPNANGSNFIWHIA